MSTIAHVKYSHWADSPEAAGVNNITEKAMENKGLILRFTLIYSLFFVVF